MFPNFYNHLYIFLDNIYMSRHGLFFHNSNKLRSIHNMLLDDMFHMIESNYMILKMFLELLHYVYVVEVHSFFLYHK